MDYIHDSAYIIYVTDIYDIAIELHTHYHRTRITRIYVRDICIRTTYVIAHTCDLHTYKNAKKYTHTYIHTYMNDIHNIALELHTYIQTYTHTKIHTCIHTYINDIHYIALELFTYIYTYIHTYVLYIKCQHMMCCICNIIQLPP